MCRLWQLTSGGNIALSVIGAIATVPLIFLWIAFICGIFYFKVILAELSYISELIKYDDAVIEYLNLYLKLSQLFFKYGHTKQAYFFLIRFLDYIIAEIEVENRANGAHKYMNKWTRRKDFVMTFIPKFMHPPELK